MEQALKENRRDRWPLVVLNLDFKTNEPAHHAQVRQVLGRYQRWLTSAPRTATPDQPSPMTVGPLLVLTGSHPSQQTDFHDRLAVGDPLWLFGAYEAPPPAGATPEARALALAATPVETLLPHRATNYRRWANFPWHVIEKGGQPNAGPWDAADRTRLDALVSRAHALGLWIRFYTLNGHAAADADAQGWSKGYNFGSLADAAIRWKAAREAKVDFVATDQYEEFARERRTPSADRHRSGFGVRLVGLGRAVCRLRQADRPGRSSARRSRPFGVRQGYNLLRRPPLAHPLVHLAVVQAELTGLPELDAQRREPVAAPVVGPRHVAALELRLEFADPCDQRVTRFERLALERRPGADLAAARTDGEVPVRLGRRHPRDRPLDADLLVGPRPVRADRGPGIGLDLGRLAAAVVGVEHDAALVHFMHQDDAAGRPAVGRARGEGHGDGVERRILRRPGHGLARAGDRVGHRSILSMGAGSSLRA